MLAYYLVKALSHILCLVPRGLSDSLGRGLALMLWPFVPKKRKLLAKQQIMDCLHVDEKEAEHPAQSLYKIICQHNLPLLFSKKEPH